MNDKSIKGILEGLQEVRVNEEKIPTNPKDYKKYILDTYGEALIMGDGTNPLYDKGIEHVKKLAKMEKKNYKDVLNSIINKVPTNEEVYSGSSTIRKKNISFDVSLKTLYISAEKDYKDIETLINDYKGNETFKNVLPLLGDCKRRYQEIKELINQIGKELS
jgi:hypothetical protein